MDFSVKQAQAAVKQQVEHGLDASLKGAQPMAREGVAKFKENHPDESPVKVLRRLERAYSLSMTSSGAAAGAAAIAPNPVAWAATLGEAGLFLTASATFALACAEVHGVHDLDELQRRVLVLGIILGNAGSAAVQKGLPRAASHWGKHFVQGVSRESLLKINRILGPNFITKYGTKQGVLVLGREVPLGIGIAIGGGGNALMSRGVIRSARRAFGPVRGDW